MASAKALLGAVAGRFLFRHGEVTSVTKLSAQFTRIDVAGPELAGAPFVAGDKVQLFFPGVGMRTYTPITWAPDGATWFVGYAHGAGPGASWVRTVKARDPVALFGPRRSIDVAGVDGPLVLIGDETSLAVAVALCRAKPDRRVDVVLEAHAADELRDVARALELAHVTVTPKGQLAPAVSAVLTVGATPLFTGRAASIQSLKQQLTGLGGKTKAYWADGKRGLD